MWGQWAPMLESLKVPTSELELGMYVSALDRPWLGTPFVTQGFVIDDRTVIDRLRENCEYVVVDTRRSHKLSSAPLRQVRTDLPKVEKDHKVVERARVDDQTARYPSHPALAKLPGHLDQGIAP